MTLGVVHTALAGFIFLGGLRRVRTDRAAILMYAEPVSAVIFAALFLGEPLTAATVAGGAMVVPGGILVARLGRPRASRTVPLEAAEADNATAGYSGQEHARSGCRADGLAERLIASDATLACSDDVELYVENAISAAAAPHGLDRPRREGAGGCRSLEGLAEALVAEGATDVVLLGMGGSSLAPLVTGRSSARARVTHGSTSATRPRR